MVPAIMKKTMKIPIPSQTNVFLIFEVSNLVGTTVGTGVGLIVSLNDRAGVLLNIGLWVEDPVGCVVGQIIGFKVGVVVGLNVGCSDGFLMGG